MVCLLGCFVWVRVWLCNLIMFVLGWMVGIGFKLRLEAGGCWGLGVVWFS